MSSRTAGLPLLAAAAFAAAPAAVRAAEADAFEGKIRPISNLLYGKAGRLEVTPGGALSLNDAFFRKYMASGKLTWHFSEWLALSGTFASGVARPTGSTNVCPPNQACSPASDEQLARVPGEIQMMAGGEIGFAPVYAKVSAFAEKVGHFDLSLLLGADWIRYRRVTSPGEAVTGESKSAVGGHAGLGARLFIAEWGAIRLEVKDYAYLVSVGGENRIEQQLMAEMGLSFFLPFSRGR